MSRKSNLKQYQTITNGDMSLSSLSTPVTAIEFLDNIGIQFNWTGSPNGTMAVQGSVDYNQDNNGNVMSAGHWTTLLSASTAAGSPIYMDFNQLSCPWIRAIYTKTSGTGTLQAWVSAKML